MDELTPERSRELAAKPNMDVDDWIKLTGMGIGEHAFYIVDRAGVRFREWDDEFIEDAPIGWQGEMCRQNTRPKLTFPCAPADVVEFIGNDLGGFGLPDEFVGEVRRLQSAAETEAEPQSAATPRIESSEYLPKNTIVAIFAPIVFTEEKWRQMLRDERSGLAKSCAHIPGRRGRGMQSQWCPLEIAKWLLDSDEATQDSSLPVKVNREFRRNRVLEHWRTEWIDYWEMYHTDH